MKIGFDWRVEKYMMIIVTYFDFHITRTSPCFFFCFFLVGVRVRADVNGEVKFL